MKPLPTLLAALACCATFSAAQHPPKPDAKSTSSFKPDTRSDHLRTESVQAPAEKKPVSNVRLNLNSASAPELAKLPGINDARARAIVKGRPYKSKEELLSKKILTPEVYEDVKGNLYAGR